MLIRVLDAETLAEAERLSREVAARLGAARTVDFASEAEAEAYMWDVVRLLQQQAAVTARILTLAIDARVAAQSQE